MEHRNGEIREVTLLQSIGIFLVVFGHSYVEINQHRSDAVLSFFYWLHNFIYSFHMPLFMFISGLLFAHKYYQQNGLDYGKYILARFKRLIIPYVVLSSLTFPIKAVLNKYAVDPVNLNFISYIKSLIYPYSNPIFFYWFLPTLFAISLFAPFLLNLARGRNKPFILTIITLLLVILNVYNPFHTVLFNIKGIAAYLIYFWGGCVFYIMKDRLEGALRNIPLAAGLFVLLIGINCAGYSNTKINIIPAFLGIFAVLCVTYRFLDSGLKVFKPINGNAYQIYLLSWFPQIFVKIALYNILHLGFYVSFVFMLLGGIIFPLAAKEWIRKSMPRLNILIGLR